MLLDLAASLLDLETSLPDPTNWQLAAANLVDLARNSVYLTKCWLSYKRVLFCRGPPSGLRTSCSPAEADRRYGALESVRRATSQGVHCAAEEK